MNVSCLRPKISELMFFLYSRPLHPELFEVRREQTIHRDDYHATVRITDACHLITWRFDNACLTEAIAHRENPLPVKRRLLACRVARERNERMQFAPNVVYQTSVTVEQLGPEVFHRVHDELEIDAQRRGIFHNFRPHHRLALSPLSHIAIEARARSLLVQTFHTFPDDCAILKSQSLFEFGC